MNILVTGASGFVGTCLMRYITKKHTVYYISRRKADGVRNAVLLKADITDQRSLHAAYNKLPGGIKFDAFVHLAAYVPRKHDEDNLKDSVAVNVSGLMNVLDVFGDRVDKVILGSSAEVYDLDKINHLISEDSPVKPKTYYGATKLASEYIALTYGHKMNIPVAVLRFSVMYGPDDPTNRALPNFIKRALNNETIELNGSLVRRDYIHVRDVVESISNALIADYGVEVFNIGTGVGVTIKQAAEAIVELSNSKSEIKIISENSGGDVIMDTSRASTILGYKPKLIFPDGVAEMIESYRAP